MTHGGVRKGAGRKATGKKGKTITINCHERNINLVARLASESKLSKVINELLTTYTE